MRHTLFLLTLCLPLFQCSRTPADEVFSRREISSVAGLSSAYDDAAGSVYIQVDVPKREQEAAAVVELMIKVAHWQRLFPKKRINTWSVVTGDEGSYGHPVVAGLLIHYERQ
ncbi:MAG TPA: hypothetical protein VJC16_01620 [Candidatus Nanoarchaeia archaeon]|nr:hypothetical protein [Candidatus Nanoarchaeia archaeon]